MDVNAPKLTRSSSSTPEPSYCVSPTTLQHPQRQWPIVGPVPRRKRNAYIYICLYQLMKVFRWCFELRPDLNDIIFEERRDLSVFKVFLCPDIGRDFRCWIELGWAWMRRKKGSSKNFIPPPLASQFVNQKLRIVRSCPSSASWNGLHFVQRLNSPSWIHFVGYIDDLIAFSSFQLDFEFYRWLIREEKKSTNI